LVYWGDATIIFPLTENNLYTIAPHVPTERNNKYALKFKEKFPDYDLLEVIICIAITELINILSKIR
jgi:hypothetical protein